MPLKSGSSNDAIGENIARLMSEGKPQDQAVAIALSQAGRSNKGARFRRAFDSFLKKGGAGSGNFGHSGRMGEVGGSGGGGGAHESNPSFSERQANAKAQAAYFRTSAGRAAQTAMNYFDGAPRGSGASNRAFGSKPSSFTPERRLVAHLNLDHRHFVEGTKSQPRVDSHDANRKAHQSAHDSGATGHTHPGSKVNEQYPFTSYHETDAQSLARALRLINGKTGIADVLKDFAVGDGLQDYNLGPGQKKPKTRKKGRTAKTVFEQFPRDYVVRDKGTGIADIIKGGPGSGNFGHAGRAGEVGGSEGGGGGSSREAFYQSSRAFNERAAERERAVDAVTTDKHLIDAQVKTHLNDAGILKPNGELKAGLGRRHFEAVASGIKARGGDEHVARAAAERLRASNPLFNTERFINAATGKGSTTPGRLGHTKDTAQQIRQAAQASRDQLRAERDAGLINIDLRRKSTGIADVLKYTADQLRHESGKFIPGSADVRHRSGSYRRGILPGMHYHGNQPHVHQGGDTSHGHKPGAV